MKESDITKTGPLNASQLLELNALSNDEFSQYLSKGMRLPSLKEITRNAGFSARETPVGNIVAETEHGESRYDPKTLTDLSYLKDIENTRALKQPGYVKLANGIAKAGVLAGTTFLDGTLGLATGLGTMATEGKWRISALWDNPFSQAMKDINDWSEKNIPNYYTDYEKEAPFHKNIFTANFIGDKFIKNLGFTVGAFYSGSVYTAPLKGARMAKLLATAARSSEAPAAVSMLVGGTLSAVNEGRIEALNNSTDWADLQEMKLNDTYNQSVQNIKAMYGDSDLTNTLIAQEDANYEESLAEIGKNQAKMGNANMLFNLPILMASNIIQFGKLFGGGYKTARKVNNIRKKAKDVVETTAGKPTSIARALLNPLSEGVEEMSQSMVSTAAGEYYEDTLDNYFKKKIDPEAEQEAISWIKTFGQAINETVNDNSAWEEFFIGTLTGALGMPSFGKSNTQSDQTWLGKGKLVGLSGGIVGELMSQKKDGAREQSMVDHINNTLQSPESKTKLLKLTATLAIGNDKEKHLENDDAFEYKNAEHKEFVNNISIFDNAGLLTEYTDMIEDALVTTDENLDAIIDNTTEVVKDASGKEIKIGPFIDKNGNPMHSTPEGKKEMIEKVSEYKTELLNKVEEYRKAKEEVDMATGQRLSDDLLEELTWLKTQAVDWDKRGEQISGTIRTALEKIKGGLSKEIAELQMGLTDAGARGLSQEELDAGGSPGDISKAYTEREQGLKNAQHVYDQIEAVLTQSDKVLGTYMTSEKSRQLLDQELSNAVKQGYMDMGEVVEVKKGVDDLHRIYSGIQKYNLRLNAYYNNPNMLADEIEQAELEVVNAEAKKVVDNMGEVNTISQLKERLEGILNPKLRAEVIEQLNTSENTKLKVLTVEYNKINESQQILSTILDNSEIAPHLRQSINNILIDAFEGANSLKEAEDTIAKFILTELNTEDESAGAIVEVLELIGKLMDAYTVAKKIQDTNSKDNKKAKRGTAKKKGTTKKEAPSFFEMTTDDANTPDAGLEKSGEDTETETETETDTEKTAAENAKKVIDTKVAELEDEKKKAIEKVKSDLNLTVDPTSETPSTEDVAKADKEIEKITKLYDNRIDKVLNPPVLSGDNEVNSNIETNAGPIDQDASNRGSLRSWKESQYDFNDLKDRGKRKITRRRNSTVDKLERLGAYSFVDSGKLGKVVQKYPDTKIHYILSEDMDDTELLAIEITDDIRKLIGRADNEISINGKQYLIVGALGFNAKNRDSKNNIQGIKRALRDESQGHTGPYFVSEKFHNKVSHMYSGRMVKSTESSGVSQKNVDKEFLGGEGLNLGFYYRGDDFRTPTIDRESEIVEPLNTNNNNPKEGSVWLMSKEADGKWYAKAVQVKRFTNEEFPLLENMNTPIVLELLENLTIFADPKSTLTDRLLARDIIEGWLHFPQEGDSKHSLLFKEVKDNDGNVSDVIISIDKLGLDIGKGTDPSAKALEVLTALQDETLSLRFQISPSLMLNETEVNMILDSGILTTDLYQLRNVNASFDLYLNDLKTGEPLTDGKKEASLGHTGLRGINSSLQKETIYVRGKRYSLDTDNKITDSLGKPVTDSDTISEILLFGAIARGEGTSYKGSALYIGTYKDGSEFGIRGKKVFRGDSMIKEMLRIDKQVADKKKKELAKKVAEEIEKDEATGDYSDDAFADAPEVDGLIAEDTTGDTLKNEYDDLEELLKGAPEVDGLIPAENTPKSKSDKVLSNINKETKKEQPEMKKKGTPKSKAKGKTPFIGNSFNDTVLVNREKGKSYTFNDYLKENEDDAFDLFDKLGISTPYEIDEAVEKLNAANQTSNGNTAIPKKADVERRREDFPETQSNTRTPITQKLLDYFAEVMGLPKFTEDLTKGTYISWLQKFGELGYNVAGLLNSPKRAFDLIAKYEAEIAAIEAKIASRQQAQQSKLPKIATLKTKQQMKDFVDTILNCR